MVPLAHSPTRFGASAPRPLRGSSATTPCMGVKRGRVPEGTPHFGTKKNSFTNHALWKREKGAFRKPLPIWVKEKSLKNRALCKRVKKGFGKKISARTPYISAIEGERNEDRAETGRSLSVTHLANDRCSHRAIIISSLNRL